MTSHFTGIKRLLFVIPSKQFGGAEKHSLELCDDFVRCGVEVAVLSTRQCLANPAFVHRRLVLLAKNIAWDDSQPSIDNAVRQEVMVDEVLTEAHTGGRRFDFAFVCAPWPHYACGAHSRLAMRNIPHILISHLFPHDRREPRYVWPAQIESFRRAASACSHAWVGVSWPISRRIERLLRLDPNSVTTIENAIDVEPLTPKERILHRRAARARLGLAPNKKVALALGRLDIAKGADIIPAIVERIADVDPLLICAGEGRLSKSLFASPAARRGLIKLLGYVAQPDDLLFAADALLLPSRLEGHPLAFLDAAARRCPVVATDTALECYGESATALALVAPMDNTAALADGLRTALVDPAALEVRVEAAYRIACARGRTVMIRSYKTLVRQVLAARHARPIPRLAEVPEEV